MYYLNWIYPLANLWLQIFSCCWTFPSAVRMKSLSSCYVTISHGFFSKNGTVLLSLFLLNRLIIWMPFNVSVWDIFLPDINKVKLIHMNQQIQFLLFITQICHWSSFSCHNMFVLNEYSLSILFVFSYTYFNLVLITQSFLFSCRQLDKDNSWNRPGALESLLETLLEETGSFFVDVSCSIIIAQYIFAVSFHEGIVDKEDNHWDAMTCEENL